MPVVRVTYPVMAYNGSVENRALADAFVAQTLADPLAMTAALDLIVQEPLGAETFVRFTEADTDEGRLARIKALGAAVNFLAAGRDSSRVAFDRTTETMMGRDLQYKRLLRERERQRSSPTKEAQLVRSMRARRLAIFAGRLAAANDEAREIA